MRRGPAAPWRHLGRARWWAWIGGFCAAVYLTASLVLVPRLGTSVTIVLTVAGQQLASALIDHFGWLGMPKRPVSVARGAGVVLLAAGAAAIRLL